MRSIYADWERGNYNSVEWADPEIEFVQVGETDRPSARGLAAMAEAWREWLEAWDNFRAGAEGYRDLGDSVLVLNFSAVGKTSGLEVGRVQTPGASMFDIREGKVTRLVIYGNRDQAFSDLGLTPDAGT